MWVAVISRHSELEFPRFRGHLTGGPSGLLERMSVDAKDAAVFEEFRPEAVRLLRSSGRPIPQLARELGCSEQSLRNWSRQVAVDEGEAEGLTTDEREELRRLRRENLILAEERDILKKAAAFFAKDSETR